MIGERDVLADVTPEAVRELDLEPGREVWVSVKESAISRYSAAQSDSRASSRPEHGPPLC